MSVNNEPGEMTEAEILSAATAARPFGEKEAIYVDDPTGDRFILRVPSLADKAAIQEMVIAMMPSMANQGRVLGMYYAMTRLDPACIIARLQHCLKAAPDSWKTTIGGMTIIDVRGTAAADPEKEDQLVRVDIALRKLIDQFHPAGSRNMDPLPKA